MICIVRCKLFRAIFIWLKGNNPNVFNVMFWNQSILHLRLWGDKSKSVFTVFVFFTWQSVWSRQWWVCPLLSNAVCAFIQSTLIMTISEGPIIVIQNNQVFAVSRKLVYYTKIYIYWSKNLLQGIHGNVFFEFDITMLKPFDMYKNIYF